jgi:chitinase
LLPVMLTAMLLVSCTGDPAARGGVPPSAADTAEAEAAALPTTTTSPTTTASPARTAVTEPRGNAGGRVVGYYAGWERDTLAPAAIPKGLVTHVVYAFATVTADSACRLVNDGERTAIAELQQWKRSAGAQTLLAVGGWEESRHFSAAAATASGRTALSCVALARQLGFDGLDLDWEYPSGGKWNGRLADPANYVALIAAMRGLLQPGELLTIASPAAPGALDTFGVELIASYVDWFNVMTYDFAGPWDDTTGHNAPLDSARAPFGAQPAVAFYEQAGVAPAKLVLGVPFYGHAFAKVANTTTPDGGIGEPFTGSPSFSSSGAMSYRSIAALVGQRTWARQWDEIAQVPWLVNTRDQQVISYDDATSMRAKGAFALEAGLGGVMVWELSGDDASWSLLRALNGALGR